MPRRPKFIHPVRAVRLAMSKALGHSISQPAFAKMVGTSPATIQSVELGRLPLSLTLARRIASVAKVRPKTLLKNRGKPQDFSGKHYTCKSFLEYKNLTISEAELEIICRTVNRHFLSLFRKANVPNKNRLLPLLESLEDWCNTTNKEFGLGLPENANLTVWQGKFNGKPTFFVPDSDPVDPADSRWEPEI